MDDRWWCFGAGAFVADLVDRLLLVVSGGEGGTTFDGTESLLAIGVFVLTGVLRTTSETGLVVAGEALLPCSGFPGDRSVATAISLSGEDVSHLEPLSV